MHGLPKYCQVNGNATEQLKLPYEKFSVSFETIFSVVFVAGSQRFRIQRVCVIEWKMPLKLLKLEQTQEKPFMLGRVPVACQFFFVQRRVFCYFYRA